MGGKRINHMLYADDLCIVSLSSAGLQQLLTICDQDCAVHSITLNVKKSVCMFFRCRMNKTCDITNVVLSGNTIDYVHKTKYLGVLLCSDMKTSIDPAVKLQRITSEYLWLWYRETTDVVRKYFCNLGCLQCTCIWIKRLAFLDVTGRWERSIWIWSLEILSFLLIQMVRCWYMDCSELFTSC